MTYVIFPGQIGLTLCAKTEMSYPISGKNKKTITSLSSAESANRVLKVKLAVKVYRMLVKISVD